MPLAGRAFLALWNDIARAREAEYDTWHTREHVPERVAVTGFAGARRYVNRGRATHRYFTLYEVADLAVFEHPEYADLTQHPTPWSAAMRPDFANFLRATCAVVDSRGEGIGGALAILAFSKATPDLAAILDVPGVVGCHLGTGSGGSSPIPWTTAPRASAPVRNFDRLLLVEALARDRAEHALAQVRSALRLDPLPQDFGNDVYDLAFVFPGHDAAARAGHRRQHWQS